MLVVASLAYTVEAETEDEAEDKLLEFLTEYAPSGSDDCAILKIWVSARQDDDERVADLTAKEESALGQEHG